MATWYLLFALSRAETLPCAETPPWAKVANAGTITNNMRRIRFMLAFIDRYSHSMVAGGLLLISYTTRLMPFTLLMISVEMCARKS